MNIAALYSTVSFHADLCSSLLDKSVTAQTFVFEETEE